MWKRTKAMKTIKLCSPQKKNLKCGEIRAAPHKYVQSNHVYWNRKIQFRFVEEEKIWLFLDYFYALCVCNTCNSIYFSVCGGHTTLIHEINGISAYELMNILMSVCSLSTSVQFHQNVYIHTYKFMNIHQVVGLPFQNETTQPPTIYLLIVIMDFQWNQFVCRRSLFEGNILPPCKHL